MAAELFEVVWQCRLVVIYRRFGTTYRSLLHRSSNPLKWDQQVVPKFLQPTINLCCVKNREAVRSDVRFNISAVDTLLLVSYQLNHVNPPADRFAMKIVGAQTERPLAGMWMVPVSFRQHFSCCHMEQNIERHQNLMIASGTTQKLTVDLWKFVF